jgi:predicted nucleotidyltransferase
MMSEEQAKPEESEQEGKKPDFEKGKKMRETFLRAKTKAAERFSAVARQKLGNMVKSVALIGSLARGDFKPGSDIDMLVILDDTQRDIPEELKDKMLAMLNEIAKGIDKKATVQAHTVTEMFQFAKEGDNIIYNFLRHMKIIYDGGILKPMRKLLAAGEIKPTKESIMRSMEGADFYMKKVDEYLEWILERYYRAITWGGNAFLMSMNEQPASVPELPIVLKKYADQGATSPEVPLIAAEVIKLFKEVEHKEVHPTVGMVNDMHPKVLKFLDLLRKDVVGSVMGEGIKGTMKLKIKTMPKIIFEFEKSRCFVWLLDEGVFLASYEGDKLSKVFKSKIDKGAVGEFKAVKNDTLFSAMENSELKPLVNVELMKTIFNAIPEGMKAGFKKVQVEFPGRAMLDLGDIVK